MFKFPEESVTHINCCTVYKLAICKHTNEFWQFSKKLFFTWTWEAYSLILLKCAQILLTKICLKSNLNFKNRTIRGNPKYNSNIGSTWSEHLQALKNSNNHCILKCNKRVLTLVTLAQLVTCDVWACLIDAHFRLAMMLNLSPLS